MCLFEAQDRTIEQMVKLNIYSKKIYFFFFSIFFSQSNSNLYCLEHLSLRIWIIWMRRHAKNVYILQMSQYEHERHLYMHCLKLSSYAYIVVLTRDSVNNVRSICVYWKFGAVHVQEATMWYLFIYYSCSDAKKIIRNKINRVEFRWYMDLCLR